MGLQSICSSFPKLSHSPSSPYFLGASAVTRTYPSFGLRQVANSCPHSSFKWTVNFSLLPKVKGARRIYALQSNSNAASIDASLESNGGVSDVKSVPQEKVRYSRKGNDVSLNKLSGIQPFGGKPGSVSFYGVTHHMVEESKLVSSPFKDDGGTVLWVLAPLVFILSLILPPIFITNAVGTVFKNEFLADIGSTLACEAVLYAGFAIFLLITDRIQRPYLEFSAKRWGLITGLKGHLSTSFFVMGLKVVAPLVVTYVTWPTIGAQALVAVSPLLVGYLAQLALESFIDRQGSSCWPLVPIIFEVYRFYQLTRAVNYVESLIFAMNGALATPEVIERSRALAAMSATFYVVALVCLWSLLTFLLRLFPSRPVSEKY